MKTKVTSSKLKISTNWILVFIYILAIGDYIITYWGVNILKIISEANPLMVKFMELPFEKGLLYRCLLSFLPLFLLKSVETKFGNKKKFKLILGLVFAIQVVPNALHMFWINAYFK